MYCGEHGTADFCPSCMAEDYDLKIRQLELVIEDLEAAHLWLDDKEVPRRNSIGEEYSLVGRICRYKDE